MILTHIQIRIIQSRNLILDIIAKAFSPAEEQAIEKAEISLVCVTTNVNPTLRSLSQRLKSNGSGHAMMRRFL